MADTRAEIRALIPERDALEQRINEISERLRSRGVAEDTRLVDSEARSLPPARAVAFELELVKRAYSVQSRCKHSLMLAPGCEQAVCCMQGFPRADAAEIRTDRRDIIGAQHAISRFGISS